MKILVVLLSAVVVVLAVALYRARQFPPFTQYRGPTITGPLALTELEEIDFSCWRSFDDIRKVNLQWIRPRRVVIVWSAIEDHDGKTKKEATKEVPEEELSDVFAGFEQQLMRAELFETSLRGSDISGDGSVWSIAGRKGDLIVTHRRINAPREDEALFGLGLRLLRVGGIEIPSDEIY